MHDWILALLADPTVSATNSTNLKIAIIAAVSLILAAAVPALLSTREREPKAMREARLDMKSQRDWWKSKSEWQDDYIDALEAVIWRDTGRDPRTFKPEGEPE
jgi:hypothetical protein